MIRTGIIFAETTTKIHIRFERSGEYLSIRLVELNISLVSYFQKQLDKKFNRKIITLVHTKINFSFTNCHYAKNVNL